MNVTPADAIQIAFGAIQIVLAWLAIRRQSEPQKAGGAQRNEIRQSTSFVQSIELFDGFAFVVSFGALLCAALVHPSSLLPWAQDLVSYFFVALAATVFALTVVRVQTNRFTRAVTHALNNLHVDGGEF